MRKRFGLGVSGVKGDVLGKIEQATGHAKAGGGGQHTDNVGPVAQDRLAAAAFGALLPAAPAPGQMQNKIKKEEGVMEEDEEL